MPTFDSPSYFDRLLKGGSALTRFSHRARFNRVLDLIPPGAYSRALRMR